MRLTDLLSRTSLTEIFTVVYVMVDDYLKDGVNNGRFTLPNKPNQKGSYSELMTIVLVGEIMQQKNQGAWYVNTKTEYQHLFPELPSLTRFYRIQKNFERLYADLALGIAEHVGIYSIDSKPLPICKSSRFGRDRQMSEATSGKGGSEKNKLFYGFKLHALTNPLNYICRFAIVPANEHDVVVARCLINEQYDDLSTILGDKGYQGCGIFTPPKKNAKTPSFWSQSFDKARKSIEGVFSSLLRSKNLMLQQLNSFWSIRSSVCRKIAAHNLILFLFS